MEAVMELLSAIPTWGWVVLGIAALFMLGDRVLMNGRERLSGPLVLD